MLRKSKAQSTAEYAIILAVAIGAIAAMQVYVKRGLQARAKAGTDAFTEITATFQADDAEATTSGDPQFKALSQYEPYYTESVAERYQENIEQEHMGDGKIVKEKVSDITATKAGGYQAQAGAGAISRDDNWTP